MGSYSPLILKSTISPADIVGLKTYWGEWDAEELKRLVPTGLTGVILGQYLINIIPGPWFRLGIGVIAVLFAGFQLLRPMLLLTYFKIGILTSDVAVWVMANQVATSGLKEAAVGAGPICDERRK
jgi:uncharacterized membrane protein YfcA